MNCLVKKTFLLVTFSILFIALYAGDDFLLNIFIFDQSELVVTSESSFYNISSDSDESRVSVRYLNISSINNIIIINEMEYESPVLILSDSPMAINEVSLAGAILLYSLPGQLIRVINRIGLEDYVSGVIAPEIGGNAPIESQKAQAVATRTYTIAKVKQNVHAVDGYDLCSSVHCQVYKGLVGQTPQSQKAVLDTKGMIMFHDNTPIEAYYSSFCGGISETSTNLWLTNHDYLMSKIDNVCVDVRLIPLWSQKNLNWEKDFTITELQNLLSLKNIIDIQITKTNSSMRVEEVMIKSVSENIFITGQYKLRNTFELPSSLFFIERNNNNIKFIGNGYGHGVGMCQIGAIARALQGHSFIEILDFYYEGIVIKKNDIENLYY